MRLRRFTLVLIATAMTLTAVPAVAWSSPVVLDGAGGANGRLDAPIGWDTAAVLHGGVRHVFYSAIVNGRHRLRHASLSASPTFETLDGAGGTSGRTTHDVGSDLSASVFGGVMHVFYRDDTSGNLRHGWREGSTWRFETLDGASTVGGRVSSNVGRRSVTATFRRKLVVLYLDVARADVRLASYAGSGWSFTTIDGDSTAAGHTIHEVGYNVQAKVWGGALHVVYYERDPAYGAELGWVREARFDGVEWRYSRAFRVNTIVLGKSLALGVVASDEVYVAYNTTLQGDTRLRWRRWNGSTWSESSMLTGVFFGDISASVLFVVVGGVPTLAFSDQSTGDIEYFTWSGGKVTFQSVVGFTGSPTSALVIGDTTAHIFWGAGFTPSVDEVLFRTTGP
jgi:hypothetical protein